MAKDKGYPIQNADPKWENDQYYAACGEFNESQLKIINAAASQYGYTESYGYQRDYRDLAPRISGRPGMTRGDYEAFRPSETVPQKFADIFKMTERVYKRVGLIRNIIDLMGDFGSQGIRLVHTDKRYEIFYKNWFEKVGGSERSERFLNNLYRIGNVIIKRQTGYITRKQRAGLMKSQSKADKKFEEMEVRRNEIPLEYLFLNPATVDVISPDIACFTNKKRYVLKCGQKLWNKLKQNQEINAIERELLKDVPKDMYNALKTNGIYPLPVDKTIVYHYKKDDWEPWAYPMTYAILDDIILLEKLKLADSAALDGAISNIRIFRLGDLDKMVIPGPAMAQKLRDILASHTSAGTIDIVWGPDIDMLESKTAVHQFLGEGKYIPVMNAIHGGIGIPPTLTGSFGASGTTNNYISLQTLIQRLEYGRMLLTEFWMNEARLVAKALGHPEPPQIEYDYMDLGDSETEKGLLIQMSDRGLVSDEYIQRRFGQNVDIEESRITRENKERDGGKRLPKSGPYYDSQPEFKLRQIALQKGFIGPKDVGVEGTPIINPNAKTGDSTPFQGRPQGSKDTKKRKDKTFKPRTKASLEIWAADAQLAIAEELNPFILRNYQKKNMRSLSSKEAESAEKVKFGVLFKMKPFSKLTKENIMLAFSQSEDLSLVDKTYSGFLKETSGDLGRSLTFDESRRIQQILYGEIYNEDNG